MNEEHKAAQLSMNLAMVEMLRRINTATIFKLQPSPPLTRWQRLQRRVGRYSERVVLAWQVLRGDDIHRDCW